MKSVIKAHLEAIKGLRFKVFVVVMHLKSVKPAEYDYNWNHIPKGPATQNTKQENPTCILHLEP